MDESPMVSHDSDRVFTMTKMPLIGDRQPCFGGGTVDVGLRE